MCELLAISSRELVAADFALERFARRGGLDGPHRDGWGIAAYEGPDVFRLREPLAAAESELVRYVDRHIPPSRLIITHIRLATRGDRALWNTQPFQRELGGRVHLFAHNGNLSGVDREAFRSRRFRPLGDTDSELVFCHLLERLAPLWDATDTVPPLADRLARVAEVAAELRPHGPANFFYADSDALFVHAHRRTQADGEVREGLHESMASLARGFVRNRGAGPKAGSLPVEGRQRRVRANPRAPSGRASKGPSAVLQPL